MARTLSVVAQQPLFKLIVTVAAAWPVVVPPLWAQESVRVTTTQPQIIHNPFAPSGAQRIETDAASTIKVKTPASTEESSDSSSGPPLRLPGSTISVLPSVGPKTYQNPFAEGLPPTPAVETPLLPGPISRWRRPVAVPESESAVRSAIIAAEPESLTAEKTANIIERAGVPWDRLPPAERLRDLHAGRNTSNRQASRKDQTDAIRFGATNLIQPEWMVPDDELIADPKPATASLLKGHSGFDPFEPAVRTGLAGEPASFVPAEDADHGPLSPTLPVEPDTVLVTVSDVANGPTGSLARAEELAKNAQTTEALTAVTIECHRAIESGPPGDDLFALRRLAAWAYNRRGELAIEAGNERDALRDFEAAIELDADCWLALHNRGVTLAQQNELEAALEDFNRVVELNPGLALAYRNRGELLAALDRMHEAVRDYDRAIEQTGHDADLYLVRGYAHHRLGDYDRALDDLNQCIELTPDNSIAYAQRGNVHAERGDFSAAIADLEQALQLDPNQAEAHRSLAWLRATCPDARYRDAELALNSAQQAVDLGGAENCFMLDALAAAYANAGQFDEAVRIQQEAVGAAPPDLAEPLQQRLVMYRQRRAFRSGPPPGLQTASHESSEDTSESPRRRKR